MLERNAPPPLRLRTVFISDIHLGFTVVLGPLVGRLMNRATPGLLLVTGLVIGGIYSLFALGIVLVTPVFTQGSP